MGNTFHRDDQDRKSQTSDYTTPRKKSAKTLLLEAEAKAKAAEKLSWQTIDAIIGLDDEVDMTDERSSFLDDE